MLPETCYKNFNGYLCDDVSANEVRRVIRNIPKSEMNGVKSILVPESGYLYTVEDKGCYDRVRCVMPDIVSIEVKDAYEHIFEGGKPTYMSVTFADGTTEKAVCNINDPFSLEQGVSICVCKKLLGILDNNASAGSGLYNKIVKRAVRLYRSENKKKAAEMDRQEQIERRKQKAQDKKNARKARLQQQEDERQINIQKEAFIRAMRELNWHN